MATVRLGRYEVEAELLPNLCIKCGVLATVHKRKNFAWHPPWVAVLILVGLLPYAIVAIILTKRMTIKAPLCDNHRSHWLWRSLFIYLGLAFFVLLGAGAVAVLAIQEPGQGDNNELGGLLCAGIGLGGLVWLIAAAIIQATAIKPTEITDRSISLTHVAPKFLDAVREERAMRKYDEDDVDDDFERRPRRRPRRAEEDDDRDSPRGRDLPPDAFRE